MTLEEQNNKNQYSKKHLRSIVDLYRQNKPKILLNNQAIRNDEKMNFVVEREGFVKTNFSNNILTVCTCRVKIKNNLL